MPQSLLALCAAPVRSVMNFFLPSASSPPSGDRTVHFDDANAHESIYSFDLYIACGQHDDHWLTTVAFPVLDASHLIYAKRPSRQLDDTPTRHQARLLYYLINGSERLSHLVTELAFLIGERKHHIVVCLPTTIDDESTNILSKTERQDIERSRRYLDDLAQKENISVFASREQSWQHVLSCFSHDY